jgi:serine/threonine protein kinase/tetratricopeptide (TPR) repeat protein
MGIVFSAWDARLHREVAIKLLREEFATSDMRTRFLQEARAASGLNHPNICTIFDIGEQDGDPYLVMELMKGETLRDRMNAEAASVRDICQVGHDIADALSVAHGRGIIHRDIKPANIFVVDRPGGGFSCKVLDFGLAKIDAMATEASLFDLTHTGTTVGTVSYMSPEQAKGETLDTRSDLFSLGVILYEMASGRLPFQGATSALVFVELLSKNPEAVRPQNPEVPGELEFVIQKLLEKDRTLRFQTGAQVVQALAQVSTSGSAAGRPIPPLPPDAARGSSATMPSAVQPAAPRQRTMVQVPQPSRHGISAAQSVARPPLPNEMRPQEEDAVPGTVPADEVLRPKKRVTASESSGFLRAARESSAMLPAAREPELLPELPEESSARIVAEPAGPAYDPDDEDYVPPTRPIVPLSARAASPPSGTIPTVSRVRTPLPKPTARFSHMEDIVGDELPERSDAPAKKSSWVLPAVAVALVVAALAAWKFWPRAGGAVGSAKVIPILLAPVTSSAGDTALAGAVAAGMSFDLSQSPQFLVEDPTALDAGLRMAGLQPDSTSPDDARRAAQAIGATEVLFAELRGSGSGYTVAVRILSADTGAEVLHSEQAAQSREQIPDALDRVVADLRNASGDKTASSVPLSREATGNIEALEAYASAISLLNRGQMELAAAAFERATAADAHFPQAFLRLADLYRAQHAMAAAATASITAQTSAQNASQRTQQLAAAAVALNATDDAAAVPGILQPLLDAYPNAVRPRVDQGEALREQGKYAESFAVLEGALHREPYSQAASAISELDLLAQERATAARVAEETAEHAGRGHAELKPLIAYLLNGGQGPIDTTASSDGNIAVAEMQAALLDAVGQQHAAMRLWQATATRAGTETQLFSAAGDAFSRAALDHALMGDCPLADTLTEQAQTFPLGVEARLRAGLAAAVCGNTGTARESLATLTRMYPQSFTIKSYGAAELNAAIAWKSGQNDAALDALQGARQYDNISLAPFLRGMIHLHSGHAQDAELDFEYVVQHPGAAAVVSPILYPMAQLGLARAYAASGDHANAGINYNKFLTLWGSADPGSPLVAEARANASR